MLVEGDNDMEIIDNYRVLITKESEFEINIERDINRTFPANDYFNGKNSSLGQDNLFKLCKAYSIYDEEIGYVQGIIFFDFMQQQKINKKLTFIFFTLRTYFHRRSSFATYAGRTSIRGFG